MSRIFIALTALSMTAAIPAMAQDVQPMPSDPTAQPPMNEPAPAQDAAPAPAPAASKADQVKAVVDAEFPVYDADKDGNLSKAEFTKWVSALRDKSGATSTADDAKATKWLADAFTAADADKSAKVSKTEMSSFLMS